MKKLRIFYTDVYHPPFVREFYRRDHSLRKKSYQAQLGEIYNQMFGNSDYYVKYFRKHGHLVADQIINIAPLAKAWSREHNFNIFSLKDQIVSRIPVVRGPHRYRWELDVLEKRVKEFRPDVIYLQDINYLPVVFLKHLKSFTRLMVGQIASRLPKPDQFQPLDLVFSSLPNLVQEINGYGCSAVYAKIGFEPNILKRIPAQTRKYHLTFVGGIAQGEHSRRKSIINEVTSKLNLDYWGYGSQYLNPSPRLKYHGLVWGRDVFAKLLQSQMTLNVHGEIAQNYANNYRLYEATGCGSLLITDNKSNLSDLFRIDKEIVAYNSSDELIEKVKYYSKNKRLREKIALAGQRRTLKEHTWDSRIRDIEKEITKRL